MTSHYIFIDESKFGFKSKEERESDDKKFFLE